MAKIRLAAAVLMLALLAVPASADWQFTKWGMSKSDVIKASGGLAVQGPQSNELSMPYTSGKFVFDVSFGFGADAKLGKVFLQLRSGGNAYLLDALKDKYGQPNEVLGPGSVSWLTATDRIGFLATLDEDKSDALLIYSPRVDTNNRGL